MAQQQGEAAAGAEFRRQRHRLRPATAAKLRPGCDRGQHLRSGRDRRVLPEFVEGFKSPEAGGDGMVGRDDSHLVRVQLAMVGGLAPGHPGDLLKLRPVIKNRAARVNHHQSVPRPDESHERPAHFRVPDCAGRLQAKRVEVAEHRVIAPEGRRLHRGHIRLHVHGKKRAMLQNGF